MLVAAAVLIGCANSPGPADMAQNGGGLERVPEAVEEDRDTSPFGAYLAGMYANQQRDLGVAADYMSKALAADPDNPRLLHATFMLMAGEGRMERARALADRLLAQNGTHGPARLLTAVERLRAGDPEAAQAALSELPGRGLSALVKPLIGAWVEVERGDTDAALETLKALEPMEGFGPLRQAHIALINDLAGRTATAAEAYEAAAGPEGARSLRLVWLIGNFHARQGDQPRAEQVYRAYMSRNPESAVMEIALERLQAQGTPGPLIETARQGAAEALFNMAGLLDQEGASDLALVYARMALFLRPDFEVGQILLGEVLQSQERGAAAIEVYRAISEASPFHYVARLRIADELQQLEDGERAVAILSDAADRHPERYEPLYRLGNLHRSRERFAEAAEAYARAIDRIDARQQRHWTLFYFRGIALERTDRWPEAERLFKTALELQPEQPYVMNYLAYSWVEQKKNLKQAQQMLRRAVELRPEDGYIVDSLGWVYYRLGKYDKAVEYLERAVELRPADPVINDHLGDAYWRVGRTQEARFQWNRALGLEPDADDISGIEAKLENGLEPAGSNG
jgi:tetratricopeptide (TPR) repeat protein